MAAGGCRPREGIGRQPTLATSPGNDEVARCMAVGYGEGEQSRFGQLLRIGTEATHVMASPADSEGDARVGYLSFYFLGHAIGANLAEVVAPIHHDQTRSFTFDGDRRARAKSLLQALLHVHDIPHHAMGIDAHEARLHEMVDDEFCLFFGGTAGGEKLHADALEIFLGVSLHAV